MSKELIQGCDHFIVKAGQGGDMECYGPGVIFALLRDDDVQAFAVLDPQEARDLANQLINAAEEAEDGGGMAFPKSQPPSGMWS